MFHRCVRLLMIWCFVALQTMSPFVHAHAGHSAFDHGGFLHTHEVVHLEPPLDVHAENERGVVIEVAHGMPVRHAIAAAEIQSMAPPPGAQTLPASPRPRSYASASLPPGCAEFAYARPPALAPPIA